MDAVLLCAFPICPTVLATAEANCRYCASPIRADSQALLVRKHLMGRGLTTRRQIVAGMAALATATGAQSAVRATKGDLPNILWIVSEDNNPFIGAYGDPLAHTPVIDGLANEGILYRNVYSNAPVCAPSRFGILTGVYPESCGPAHHMRARAHLPGFIRTYPELMREAGYFCSNNAKTDYNCDVKSDAIWSAQGPQAHWRGRPEGTRFMSVFNLMTTHESILFNPVAGRVSPSDIKVPAHLPDTAEIREDFASYYNLMEQMDAEVGGLLDALEADGLADDTIVFYYSDNGGSLPRSKRYCYDEGLRCAMVVRVPPKFAHLAPHRPGSAVEAPVSFIDLAPTVLSLAGKRAPATMQGEAFLGARRVPSKRFAFGMRNRMDERYDFVRTVTDGRYRYIRNYAPHRPCGQHQAFAWLAKGYQSYERAYLAGQCDSNQRRFFEPRPVEEFYDLRSDPDQVDNLAVRAEFKNRLNSMSRALDAHMLAIQDNGFIPEGMAAEGYEASRVPGAYSLKDIMALAADAARGDPANVDRFAELLSHPDAVMRYWAANGLLIMGSAARPAAGRLQTVMAADPSPQVRIAAAEAATHLGLGEAGVRALAGLLDASQSEPVRLQAINGLTYCAPDLAKQVLPQISAARSDPYLFVRSCALYLEAKLTDRYQPSMPIFELDRLGKQSNIEG
ncbi:arylsulfatase A-like enzyme [Sphingobium sp. B7D2B]|uniref:sulfatase-like hydrolase/transferase n=1 Tax=Sphingobium sp. B7D2B TaxID=2940583 RepID=UPI002224F947|nr:sulfatase-like hydrolase/transferase [Sphingobium sp. B7D2B]MCW2364591.1 arylsulfatase A-like enzyme [Sphingobium sp. B7D2B]